MKHRLTHLSAALFPAATIMVLAATLFSSCVSMREYESLQSQYSQAVKGWNLSKQELQELREENAELVRQGQAMTVTLSDMAAARQECEATVASINRSYAALQLRYDTTVENYMQQLTGKSRDLSKVNKLLDQRTRELGEKEKAFSVREQKLLAQQRDLESRQRELEQRTTNATQALQAKERELENLRSAVAKALVGFADKGLQVETKNGKVYVSMEDKLLFAPGSWTVSTKGVEAIKRLAKELEAHTDLNIMVEGHTDNDAYRGSTAVKDNWDLSVMRATAIVKLLLKEGPAINPQRVQAAGHGEYAPKKPNTSAANKAINRRTEIILTPHLEDIMQIITP
ncbi:MAG: OmpA family protein [Bacteroidales bacterium]|nr:OmpA family protein [Bacteroidales bacterium]